MMRENKPAPSREFNFSAGPYGAGSHMTDTVPPDCLDWRSPAEKQGGLAAFRSYLDRITRSKYLGETQDLVSEIQMNPAVGAYTAAILERRARSRAAALIKKGVLL